MIMLTEERRTTYLLRLCRTAAYTGLGVSLFWLVVFTALQRWTLAVAVLVLGLAILPCWLLARRGRFSSGLLLSQLICMIFVAVFCLCFDIPDITVNRTTHLWLLVIALVGYIHYQCRPSRRQATLMGGSLVLFALFCSGRFSFPFASPMPAPLRQISAWGNVVTVFVMLGAGMVALKRDMFRRTSIVRQIQDALDKNEFVLFYQAQVRADGSLTGAEALLRWQHPEKGILSPVLFLPDAQQAGLMPLIGEWVLREASQQLSQWQYIPEMAHLTLAMNITADHILRTDFCERVMAIVSEAELPSSLIKIELTESVFATDMPTVVDRMTRLSDAGFRFALDDFGTGFSSLSYLRQLPLEQIKVDRSFVQAAVAGIKGEVIARNIVRMGKELQLEIMAEGIETPEQWQMMQDLGCDAFQGFYFSRPITARDFEQFVKESSEMRNVPPNGPTE